jgi:hypothetical protein
LLAPVVRADSLEGRGRREDRADRDDLAVREGRGLGQRYRLTSQVMDSGFQLAQVNVARLVAPVDAPEVAEFMAALDPVNALADAAPGFVWRLQDDSGDATSIRVFDDETVLINMSVWESIDALFDFVYKGGHVEYFRRRREWFQSFGATYLALWWIPAGTIPTPDDAKAHLEHLEANGPTPYAFTFKKRFAPAPAEALPS